MISSLHSVQMKSVAIVNCINSDVDIPSSCNNFVFFPLPPCSACFSYTVGGLIHESKQDIYANSSRH